MFYLNNTLFCFASIQVRPIADHDLCPGPSSQEDRTFAILQGSKCTNGIGWTSPRSPCKEEGARAEVEAFMEHCAKRWQTKEGTYQLKRRRLLPDVRDPPEQGNADIDMQDI